MRDWAPFYGLPLWVWLFVLPTLFALMCWFLGPRIERGLRPVWRLLDGLYFASGLIAALFMLTILGLIVAQMLARWTGMALPGTSEFAGYAMAATSFFALCHAMMHGSHIRVSILLNATAFTRRWLDVFAVFCGAIIATYFSRYAIKTNGFSEMLNDRTQGQDQIPEWVVMLFSLPARPISEWSEALATAPDKMVYTPIWIPQLSMSVGTILLAVCMWDALCRMLVQGQSPIKAEAVE